MGEEGGEVGRKEGGESERQTNKEGERESEKGSRDRWCCGLRGEGDTQRDPGVARKVERNL